MDKLKNNITLIGMAGVGKSFLSRHLTEIIGYNYVSLDQLMTEEADRTGVNKFLLEDADFIKLEEKIVLSLEGRDKSIFDTGGSVVYSEKSMNFLKSNSVIIYIKDSVENTIERFHRREELHLVGFKGKTFDELLKERTGLYEKYADFTVDISECRDSQEKLDKILEILSLKKQE